MRFIIRPNAIATTPRRLKSALGARRTIPVANVISADYRQDLFLAYPEPGKVLNAPDSYHDVFSFFHANKLQQRKKLHALGLPIVPTHGLPGLGIAMYVARPLRHRGGQGFRVINTTNEYDPRTEYASQLIPKTKEFRVLYYKGKRICTYFKQNPNNIPSDQPWNVANGCRFCTITNPINDKLSASFYEKLDNCPIIKTASVVGVDVLFTNEPFICEFNFCPGLSISGTIAALTNAERDLNAANS